MVLARGGCLGRGMEKLMTVVRLHQLSARTPSLKDVQAVTELLVACDSYETGSKDVMMSQEDVQANWQEPGFQLSTDAWVIVNLVDQVVGYAEVHGSEDGKFRTRLHVHPDYRGRGIGTLLIRWLEARARSMMMALRADVPVVLSAVVSTANQRACQLYEREEYTVTRQYWRFLIEMAGASEQKSEDRALRFDLKIDAKGWSGTTHLPEQAGMYSTHLYNVYEKLLRVNSAERERDMLVC